MNNTAHVPFMDLVTPHARLAEDLSKVFEEVLRTGMFVGGPMVEGFERDFARFCGTRHCVGVASGTDALRFALIASGVRKGHTVLTVPNTFIATTEAITQAGAAPDFVDIDEQTYNMDSEKLLRYLEKHCRVDARTGRAVNKKTGRPVTAVIPVHLYGQTADMDSILDISQRYNLTVIEDACQAHGAEYFSAKGGRWRRAGSMGRIAAFSFYPGKNLGALGEGGGVTTDDDEIAVKIRMLRDHGQSQKYVHEFEGYNSRLDALQAGLLGVKLKHLPQWNAKRRENALRYNELLSDIEGVIVPYEPGYSRGVYHLYVVVVTERDALREYLTTNGLSTGLHYPVPLHLQKAYSRLGYKNGAFPVAEKTAKGLLSLPMYPELTEDQQEKVAEKLSEFMTSKESAMTGTS